MTALRLIIENHPVWQTPVTDDHLTHAPLPAPSQMIYTLLGRRGVRWHTIVPRIDQMPDAIHAMDSANRSQLFDRVVVAKAYAVAGQPSSNWDTFVCAVPYTTVNLLPTRSFGDMLARAERRQSETSETVAETVSLSPPASLTLAKTDASLWLLILLAVGLWSHAAPVLCGVALLCLLEMLYQTKLVDRLIPLGQYKLVQTGRFYLYSLCAGLIAIPLLARVMLQLLDDLNP